MAGARRDPTAGDRDAMVESRRLTPSIGLEFEADAPAPSDTANEDFLFHLYRGSELLQDNRVHEAKEELERALHLQPRDAKGQDLLAIVYFRLGHYPRAIAIYEQLRRTSPRDPALLLNLALCYLKTGQPSFARRDLAELVKSHPSHTRAWGYLGLACERLGDLDAARDAFERGGHAQLARRMENAIAGRVAASMPPAAAEGAGAEAREAVAAAFEELDAGELSFAIAEPAAESDGDQRREDWQAVEIGRPSPSTAPRAASPNESVGAAIPQLASPMSVQSRRPTLIAPAPPAAANLEATLERYPSPNPPHGLAGAEPPQSQRMPPSRGFVAPPPAIGYAAPGPLAAPGGTLAPALLRNTAPLPPASQLTRDSVVAFPAQGEVVVHASGVALVRTGAAGFYARAEALRAAATALTTEAAPRRTQGRTTAEPLGGIVSPVALFRGDGQLVVGPRPGRVLSSFLLEAETAFVREDVLLGFDGRLSYENGRVASGEDEALAMVHLEGTGAVLLEALGDVLGLDVEEKKGLVVRRDSVVAWFGRLVPRAVPASEAPAGQRGLLAFAGEGSVLFATA